jgi:hypothetical protein
MTGTGNAFMTFFIRPAAAAVLSALTGEKIAESLYHKRKKKEKQESSALARRIIRGVASLILPPGKTT